MLTLLASCPHVVVGKRFRAETLESFVQAGLRPGKPAPAEDSGVQEGDHRGVQGDHRGVQGDHLNTLNLQHKLELTELRERILEINSFHSSDSVEYKASHSSTRLSCHPWTRPSRDQRPCP